MFKSFLLGLLITLSAGNAVASYYVNGPYDRCQDGSSPSRQDDSFGGTSYVCYGSESSTGYTEYQALPHAYSRCPVGYQLVYYTLEQSYFCVAYRPSGTTEQARYTYVAASYSRCPAQFPRGPFREETSNNGVSYYCTR